MTKGRYTRKRLHAQQRKEILQTHLCRARAGYEEAVHIPTDVDFHPTRPCWSECRNCGQRIYRKWFKDKYGQIIGNGYWQAAQYVIECPG